MTFQYKQVRTAKLGSGTKPKLATVQENLTGFVFGHEVPKDEERFFRGAMKTGKVIRYFPQFLVGRWGYPGFRTIDAVVDTIMGWRAFEIDGTSFVHRGDMKKAEDKLADLQRMDGLRKMGIDPRNGIEHVSDVWLQTQPDADRRLAELL